MQADHAGAAFERVEGTPQRRLFTQAGALAHQRLAGRQTVDNHLAGFLQKDIANLCLIVVHRRRHRPCLGKRLNQGLDRCDRDRNGDRRGSHGRH